MEEIRSGSISTLRIEEIEPNKDQPRKTFDQKALSELADNIKENGIIVPLIVRPMPDGSYQLIAGERRYRASRMLGLTEVPVIIREMSDEQAMVFSLIENLQREDLNPIEEAEGFQLLIDSFGLTQEQAAVKVGRSRPAVANSLRLLGLPEKTKDLAREGKISAGHARALLGIEDDKLADSLAEDIVKRNLSVRDIEKIAKQQKPEKAEKKKTKSSRDPFYDEVELALTEALGRKVKISAGKKKTLEMEFFSKEDLQILANQLDAE